MSLLEGKAQPQKAPTSLRSSKQRALEAAGKCVALYNRLAMFDELAISGLIVMLIT